MSKTAERIRLSVQVTPNAYRSEAIGMANGVLRVRLQAPPVDGKANDALVRYLAGALRVPKSAVSIATGHGGRRKMIEISGSGLTLEQIVAVLVPVASD